MFLKDPKLQYFCHIFNNKLLKCSFLVPELSERPPWRSRVSPLCVGGDVSVSVVSGAPSKSAPSDVRCDFALSCSLIFSTMGKERNGSPIVRDLCRKISIRSSGLFLLSIPLYCASS